jgi:hypothetical protein
VDYTKSFKSQCNAACLHCGAELTQKEGPGRARRFCNGEHGKAYRRRMRHAGFDV